MEERQIQRQIKRKIEEIREMRRDLYEIYARLKDQLFERREKRYIPKKLSLEELSQALSLTTGEKFDVSDKPLEETEKEITNLVELIYKANNRGFPVIKKKTMRDGNTKYWLGKYWGECFISTACVEAANLPDNCNELQTLRRFRDTYVMNIPRGNELIREYCSIAPGIVQAIKSRPDSHDEFSRIFEDDVLVAIRNIDRGDYDKALEHYRRMVTRLKHENLSLLS